MNAGDFLFLDSGNYSHVSPLTGTTVLRFGSPVYFATVARFKQQLFAGSISLSELKARQKLANKQKDVLMSIEVDKKGKTLDKKSAEENTKSKDQLNALSVGEDNGEATLMPEPGDNNDDSKVKPGEQCDIRNIIVDCSVIPFVDTTGCKLMAQLHSEYAKHDIRFVLAGCCDDVVSSLKRVEQCQSLCSDALFPSIQNAVLYLNCVSF